MNLSFPYYMYPGTPCCEYTDIESYNLELLRLLKDIKTLDIHDDMLFHITIGAAMEEYFNETKDTSCKFQWQQLFPIHIREHLQNNKPVTHFIISPNTTFNNDSFKEPLFVSQNPQYEFVMINKGYYISSKYNYHVKLYYTMMPHIDNRNGKLVDLLRAHFSQFENINRYMQTKHDIDFILSFYHSLKTTLNNIIDQHGITTCFSFAVFRAHDKAHIYKYKMFSEIIDCYKNKDVQLLAEWIYNIKSYILINYLSDDEISYVDADFADYGKYIKMNNGKIELCTV